MTKAAPPTCWRHRRGDAPHQSGACAEQGHRAADAAGGAGRSQAWRLPSGAEPDRSRSTSSPSCAPVAPEEAFSAEYDAVAIARGYSAAGAAAISVLTEPTFFDGSLDDLVRVRAAVDVPLLRKDFVVSEYQLIEARAAGADAVLLIVGALRPDELTRLLARAGELGFDALVEVHNHEELAAALDAGAAMIGVNNRNLRTLAVDLDVSGGSSARMPKGVTAVSESGIKSPADIERFIGLRYTLLIGERFAMWTTRHGVERPLKRVTCS